jgi:hypothetical protein
MKCCAPDLIEIRNTADIGQRLTIGTILSCHIPVVYNVNDEKEEQSQNTTMMRWRPFITRTPPHHSCVLTMLLLFVMVPNCIAIRNFCLCVLSLSNGATARGGPRPPSRVSSIPPGLGRPLSSFYIPAFDFAFWVTIIVRGSELAYLQRCYFFRSYTLKIPRLGLGTEFSATNQHIVFLSQ